MILLLTVLGLIFGSFANAVIWRLKVKKSIIKDRSICPQCGHQLGAIDLIPLVSWLMLRGRCRYCHQSISAQYPLVEVLTAGLFVWSYLAWDFTGHLAALEFGIWLAILTGLVILAVYDLKWYILPNPVIYSLLGLSLLNIGILLVITPAWSVSGSRVLAAAIAGLFFYGLYALGRGRWMGGGDVKLAILMGLILGTHKTLVAMVLGFNLAAIVSLGLLAAKLKTRKDVIPFGPFLIAGTIIAMLHGQALFDAYLRLFDFQG